MVERDKELLVGVESEGVGGEVGGSGFQWGLCCFPDQMKVKATTG